MHVSPQPRDAAAAVAVVGGTRITHPERVVFPEPGITKGELACFVADVAEWALPHVAGRPLSLVRCPGGLDLEAAHGASSAHQAHQPAYRAEHGLVVPCFFQKHAHVGTPSGISRVRIREKSGTSTYLAVNDRAGLVALVQYGTLELHPWGARAEEPDIPDRLFFDLDPGPELGWQAVIEAAREVKRRLAAFGIECYVKTSGGKGLHVVAPLTGMATWDVVKRFSRAIANRLNQETPERYVATMSKELRTGRIFIDYLRNARGSTTVAPYSIRARRGAPVSTPVRWADLASLPSADAYHVRNLRAVLRGRKRDPWDGFFRVRQQISAAMLREAEG